MIRHNPTASEDELKYRLSPTQIHANAMRRGEEPVGTPDNPSAMMEVLVAPFRGAESAIRNAYNGVDLLTGDDLLPDYNGDKRTNFLGNSQTGAGQMVEGVSQFLTAFVPVVGLAGRAAGAVGLAGNAASIAGGAAAGAFADFVAFDGHEERLSNLIQKYPSLQNPVTEYLAADENDSAAEARFKNTLEGLALGAVSEPLLRALGAMGKVRKAKAGTVGTDAAKKAVSEAEQAAETFKRPTASEPGRAVIEDRPELSELGKRLATLREEEFTPGAFLQDGKKDPFRILDPNQTTELIVATARAQQQAEESAGKAFVAETIEARAQKVGKLYGELVNLDPKTATDLAVSNHGDLREAVYMMDATRRFMVYQGQRITQLAGFIRRGAVAPGYESAEQMIVEVAKSQQALSVAVLTSRKNATEVGRALNAVKFTKSVETESLDLARQAVESLGGKKYLMPELEKLAMAGDGNPEDAAKAIIDLSQKQRSLGDRLFRVHNEYWLNALLSGTKTSVVNTLGNSMTTMWLPLEAAVGGALNRDWKASAASLKRFVYMGEAMKDSMKFALRALKEKQNILVSESSVSDVTGRNAIDASKLFEGAQASKGFTAEFKALTEGGEGNTLHHFVNFTGETVRMPSRFLMATDEFFKQLNYRAAAKSELYYRGRTKGLSGDALTSYIEENFSRVITEGGSTLSEAAVIREAAQQAEAQGLQGKAYADFIRNAVETKFDATRSALAENFDVIAAARDVADEATFTRELGRMGQGLQNFVRSHPIFQLVMPFVRTPTNIVKYFGQRGLGAMTYMPGIRNLQARNLADLASENALVRAQAQGRIATGSAMVSMAALAAAEGKLTGRGPSDEQEKKLLMETGWQPYSIVIESAEGPVYVSYQRLDPLATFLGLMADWGEQAKHQDPFKAGHLETILQAAGVAVSGNITNKTYLASLAQVVDAVSQPDRRLATWSRARVASYVPSLLAQFNSSLDDGQTMKEVRDFYDAIQNRVPGGQAFLEPRRNILGEPVDHVLAQTPLSWLNPFTMSRSKGDKVFDELAQFNHGLQPPSPVVMGNVNLLLHKTAEGRTAYDRYLQSIGEVKVQGKTLRQQLERLISRPDYQKLPLTSPQDGLDSPRLFEVKRILSAYQQAALANIQKEVPSVRDAVRASAEAKAAIRRGDRARALQSVQAVIEAAS